MDETIADDFETITLVQLETMSTSELDRLPFGLVGMAATGEARIYNATEARTAGIRPESVLGLNFFEAIGQCMNNYLVAQRFEDEPDLDAQLPYVLTLRMRPTPVRLRLLARRGGELRYLLIERI